MKLLQPETRRNAAAAHADGQKKPPPVEGAEQRLLNSELCFQRGLQDGGHI